MTGAGAEIEEIRAAAHRIGGFARRTPLVAGRRPRGNSELAHELLLKLESLQVTGSFKARGAVNAVFGLPPESLRGGGATASGGNHGLAVAYAGRAAGIPATIFLPRRRPRQDRQARRPGGPGGDFWRGLGRQEPGSLAMVNCPMSQAALDKMGSPRRDGPY